MSEEYPRFTGEIVGRIKRRTGVGKSEARTIASGYDWYHKGLVYDGRCKRWHVFRCKDNRPLELITQSDRDDLARS